jgi:GntR family transcriptional regulator
MTAAIPGSPPDLDHSGISRYLQLATLFRRMIESGQWKLEARIPTVDILAADYGVARATIRQALGLLENEGLIKRYRAKGTFVVGRPRRELWCEVGTDWSGMLMSREDAVIEVLSDDQGSQPPFLPHPVGTPAPSYRHLRRRHSRQGQAFLLADVYLDERLCRKLPKKVLSTKSAMRLVADIPGLKIIDARQTLTIGIADMETAELLRIPINAPVAHVYRTAVDENGSLVLVGMGIYRGDVVSVNIKMR